LRSENAGLRNKLGYLEGDVAAAIQKEIDTLNASLGAAQAAVNTLRTTGA
jgi:hypothetical protein